MINTTGLHHINEPFHYDELYSLAVSQREEPLLRRGTESDSNIFVVFFSDDGKKDVWKKQTKKQRKWEREKERKSTAVVCVYLFRIEILRWAQNPHTHIAVDKFRGTFWRLESCVETTEKLLLIDFFAVYGRSYLAAYHAVRLYNYIYDISAVYWIALMPAAACLGCRWAGSAAEEKEKGKIEWKQKERTKERKGKNERRTSNRAKTIKIVCSIFIHIQQGKRKEK